MKETIHIISKKEVEKNLNYPAPSWGNYVDTDARTDQQGNICYRDTAFEQSGKLSCLDYSMMVRNAFAVDS